MAFEKTTVPPTSSAFVYKRNTAPDDYVPHAGPGPAGAYPSIAEANLAAQQLMGAPTNCFDTQVFVADPTLHYQNAVSGD